MNPTLAKTALTTAGVYVAASFSEIAGCFAFWAWARLGKPIWWLLPGIAALALFAWLLTLAPGEAAGRAYGAYGGVYIAASLAWLWAVEGVRPDRWEPDRRRDLPRRGGDHPVRSARHLKRLRRPITFSGLRCERGSPAALWKTQKMPRPVRRTAP